ncbi:hypothetical protein VTN96DRAFT_4263 [Rasamsonia emersonii]
MRTVQSRVSEAHEAQPRTAAKARADGRLIAWGMREPPSVLFVPETPAGRSLATTRGSRPQRKRIGPGRAAVSLLRAP